MSVSASCRQLLTVVAAIALVGFSAQPAHLQETDLVAAFGFEEGSGTIFADSSGNNLTGTKGGATWAPGRFGTALAFDGANDMATVLDSPLLDLTDSMTLEAWVYPVSTSNIATILLKEGPGQLAYALYASTFKDRPSAELFISSGPSVEARSFVSLSTNAWSHMAASFDGVTLRLYINGVLVGNRTRSGSIATSNSPLRIGGNTLGDEYFAGRIDEVRIYGRVLSATEIQADMEASIGSADITPPSVSITSPVAAATVSNAITVTAGAADDSGVAGVQFLLDGAPLGSEDTTSPYAVTWDTRPATNTTHILSARARDTRGNVGVAADVAVTVANAPTLTITEPTAGASINGSTVDIAYATAGDLTGVDHVHFRLDSGAELMDMSFDGAFQLTGVPPGQHILGGHLVRSDHTRIDGTDAALVSFATVAADVTAPTVTLTAPADGSTLSGTVDVTATAVDDVAVASVQFLLDGADLGARDTATPFAISWETTAVASGPHTLSVVAFDSSGNTATSQAVSVTVSNLDPAAQTGKWGPLMNWPLVAVHGTLMHTGEILLWDGWEAPAQATIWNPATNTFRSVPNQSGLFCSAHSMLADGRILVTGGHAGGEVGIVDVNAFDPVNGAWKIEPNMSAQRWYPSSTTLSDGRVLVVSGQTTPGIWADTPEIYDPATSTWTSLNGINTSDVHDPEYLLTTLLPDGRIAAIAASTGQVRVLDLARSTWTDTGSNPQLLKTSVAMFRPGRILATGGGDVANGPSDSRASVIDFDDAEPAWREIAPMAFPRYDHNLVVLADGSVLAVGGATTVSQTALTGTLAAELWNPVTETWQTMASMSDPRMYHSIAMLLPDGRVLSAGGGRLGGARDYFTGQIFSPPYLFKGTRPAIQSAPSQLPLGSMAEIQTADAPDISSVALVRLGSVTHTLDMEQRFLNLEFTAQAGRLTVAVPSDANLVPPGYYMLFILNSKGVPSTAAVVRVPAPQEDVVAPTAPQNLQAVAGTTAATLTWVAAADNSTVTAYNVHRSTTSGFVPSLANRMAHVAGTTYTDFVPAGTYAYVVTAEDAAGNVSAPSNEAFVNVAADTVGPTVAVTQPVGGAAVAGLVALDANASDNVVVAGVRFLIDGVSVGVEDTTVPYAISWDSRAVANGMHTVSAIARDSGGNETASAPVTISVENIATGLVLALGFDEGVGTNTADVSGSNNNGTISGATWTVGRFGHALSFDGVNDLVSVADSNSLDLSTGMTLQLWLQPRALNGYMTAIVKERPSHLAYALYANTDTTGAAVEIAVATNLDARSTLKLPLNSWSHLAATYDGAALRLYVNGELVSTRAVSGPITTSASPLRIGGNNVWGEFFNGLIDEVRVYNRALTAQEIQGDMNLAIQP